MPESSRREMSMSSEDAPYWSSPARDALADSVFNSKGTAEEMAKPMDSFAISSERPAPASDMKSKISPIQGCRILGSARVVELPPPVRFIGRIRTISAAPRGPTPAKESVDVFGAGCMASLCHQHRSQSDESASRAVALISENGDLQMLWTLLMGIEHRDQLSCLLPAS